MSERLLQQQILLALGARPDCRVWRSNTGGAKDGAGHFIRFGTPGTADILGLLRPTGRLIALEVKTPSGRLSADQQRWGAMVTEHGGLYLVVHSVAEAVLAIDRAALAQLQPAPPGPTP